MATNRGRCGCGQIGVINPNQGVRVTGSGSTSDPYTVGAHISDDQGNCLSFGGDGGLYSPCGGAGSAPPGWVSVAGLPTAVNSVLCGFRGAGRLVSPDNLQRSFRRAVSGRLHIAHLDVRALQDGTLLVTAATGAADVATGIPMANDSPITRMTGIRAASIAMDVSGLSTDYVTSNPADGWWGFAVPNQVGIPTVEEILGLVGNRIVLLAEIGEVAGLPNAAPLLLPVLQRYGVTKSVIVASSVLSKLPQFVAAGMAAAIVIPDAAAATANPPAAVVAAGVGWVVIDKALPDATIQGYVAAGLQVLPRLVDRHAERQRMINLGVRGVISQDPFYYSAEPARYKRTGADVRNIYSAKLPEYGQLSVGTDMGDFPPGGLSLNCRGYYSAATEGLRIPASVPATHTANGFYSILVGNLSPIADASFRVRFSMQFVTAPSAAGRWLGLSLYTSDNPARDDSGAAELGYMFAQTYSGVLVIYKKNAGPGVAIGSSFDWGTPATGVWYELTLQVTPTELRLYRTADEGTPANHAVAADTTFRGPMWLSLCKAETTTPFEGMFKEVSVLVP